MALEDSVVSLKYGDKFCAEYDSGIRWDDADIGVAWPLEKIGGKENLILSEKDKSLMSFREFMNLELSQKS